MKINTRALTFKYKVRLTAAMAIEAKGYRWAKENLTGLGLKDWIELEKAFLKFNTLYHRGVARYVRELINKGKVA